MSIVKFIAKIFVFLLQFAHRGMIRITDKIAVSGTLNFPSLDEDQFCSRDVFADKSFFKEQILFKVAVLQKTFKYNIVT